MTPGIRSELSALRASVAHALARIDHLLAVPDNAPEGRTKAAIVLPDALREIERLKCDLSDVATALNGRLAEATAENEQLRDTVHNYKALLAAAEAAGREVCDERDDARRLVTLERRVGRWMSTEDEEALRRLRQEAREWDGSKVDQPARHTRHDRHCMIHDGVRCSHEPGCEVER